MLFSCAQDSLSSEGIAKIYARQSDYHVNGVESGLLLVKVILEELGLRTNATVAKYKRKLQCLPELMLTLRHDVIKFNQQHWKT